MTHSINNIDPTSPAGGRRFDYPRPLGPIMCRTKLLILIGHQKRGGYEVKMFEAAEILHFLYVLEQLVFTRQFVWSVKVKLVCELSILQMTSNRLHAVSRTHQGGQREPSVKTLRSPFSTVYWRHCVLSGGFQSEEMK